MGVLQQSLISILPAFIFKLPDNIWVRAKINHPKIIGKRERNASQKKTHGNFRHDFLGKKNIQIDIDHHVDDIDGHNDAQILPGPIFKVQNADTGDNP